MNNPYFICETCKIRVEAGYRWTTSHLRSDAGTVEFGRSFNVRDALNYRPFWDLPKGDEYNWLRELLPMVRAFLECHECHESHAIRFDDDVSFSESYFGFEWLDVSPLPDLVPRYFVEQLGYNRWQQVCDHIDSLDRPPWWWNTDDHQDAKRTFEQLANEHPITKP